MLTIKLPKFLPKEKISVIKVICGEQFYICKTASLTWFEQALKKYYGKYAYRNGIREDNMFYEIVKSIYKQKLEIVHIDVIFSSDNGYKALQYELNQLLEHYGSKKCLNDNKLPIVPKTSYNEANAKKWLTVNQSLNYYRYLKKVAPLHQ